MSDMLDFIQKLNQEPPELPKEYDILWKDISYHTFFTIHSHHLEFKVYSVNALNDKPLYEEKEPCSNSWVEDVTLSHVFLSGSIKWDGCSNMHFDQQDQIMLHFCSKEDAENIGVLLGRLYDGAQDLLETWDGD